MGPSAASALLIASLATVACQQYYPMFPPGFNPFFDPYYSVPEVPSPLQDCSEKTGEYSQKPKTSERIQKPSTPEECARECIRGARPKMCYYQFTVEFFATLTNACKLCRSNSVTGVTSDCQCITADGYETSGIITANRMYPGPAIMVCKGDTVVIDVTNHLSGNAITIHWHGILQHGSQYYDGVPFVTQCPIVSGTTFRYRWKAVDPGTHFWHAHTGFHKGEGLDGPLIVREPKWDEENHDLWDFDLTDNVIFLSDWLHDSAVDHFPGTLVRNPGQLPDNFLINGKGQWTDPISGNTTKTPLAVFQVKPGYRYRFRMINSCSLTCPVLLTIQGHGLAVIATDGEPIEPVYVTSITSSSAERYDFVVTTDKRPGDYWVQVRGLGVCSTRKLHQLAILHYERAPRVPEFGKPTYDQPLPAGIILNPLNVRCDGSSNVNNVVCINQLNSVQPVPREILLPEPDIRLYLPVGFHRYEVEEVFKPGTYNRFSVVGGRQMTALLGNISNAAPPSPMISQWEDTPSRQFCSTGNLPAKCRKNSPCVCSHVEEIPLNSVVEVIIVDEAQIPGLSHPFHLHGHVFYVMGSGFGSDYSITTINVDNVKELHSRGLIERRMASPPSKDTFAVPNNGFSVIRFIADNPGYWNFHCHFLFHIVQGMSLVFHVGDDTDLPPIPRGFPKCGDFKPPI